MPITAIQYQENPKDPLLTASEYARHKKVSPQAISKMAKRHGVKLDQARKAPLSVWLAADQAGLAMDKNTASARASHSPEGSLANQAAKLKIKKLSLEAEKLQLDIDATKGEMVPKAEHRSRVQGICGLCMRLIDTVAANWATEVRDPVLYGKLLEGIDGAKRAILAECAPG